MRVGSFGPHGEQPECAEFGWAQSSRQRHKLHQPYRFLMAVAITHWTLRILIRKRLCQIRSDFALRPNVIAPAAEGKRK